METHVRMRVWEHLLFLFDLIGRDHFAFVLLKRANHATPPVACTTLCVTCGTKEKVTHIMHPVRFVRLVKS